MMKFLADLLQQDMFVAVAAYLSVGIVFLAFFYYRERKWENDLAQYQITEKARIVSNVRLRNNVYPLNRKADDKPLSAASMDDEMQVVEGETIDPVAEASVAESTKNMKKNCRGPSQQRPHASRESALDAIAAAGLGAIERLVGNTDQRRRGSVALDRLEATYAQADGHDAIWVGGMRDSLATHFQPDLLGDGAGSRHIAIGQDHDKLFPAVTRCQIARTPLAGQDGLADLTQALIAGQVAIHIVVQFEMIDVDHDQREALARALGAVQFACQHAVEMASIGQPGQAVLHSQARQGMVQFFHLGARLVGFPFRNRTLVDLAYHAPSHHSKSRHQYQYAGHMHIGVGAPFGEHLVNRQRHRDKHRIRLQMGIAVDAQHAVLRRLDERHATGVPGGIVSVERGRRHALADRIFAQGPAECHGAVVQRQQYRPGLADIETGVEMLEIRHIYRGQHHSAETAVSLVDAARNGGDPFAAGATFDRRTDMGPGVGMIAVIHEVAAIGVIEAVIERRLRIDQPATFLVVDKQAVELRQFLDAQHQ